MGKKRKKSKRQRSQVFHGRARAADAKRMVMVLTMSAPAIEAIGNVNRAIELGVIQGDRQTLRMLVDAVPMSRGGRLEHPDAEMDWAMVVKEAVDQRGLDLEEMRLMYAQLSE